MIRTPAGKENGQFRASTEQGTSTYLLLTCVAELLQKQSVLVLLLGFNRAWRKWGHGHNVRVHLILGLVSHEGWTRSQMTSRVRWKSVGKVEGMVLEVIWRWKSSTVSWVSCERKVGEVSNGAIHVLYENRGHVVSLSP